MQLIPVESSTVAAIGYDPATRTMEVRFHSGAAYRYQEVSAEDHSNLMGADSIGRHLTMKIAHYPESYPCVKLTGPTTSRTETAPTTTPATDTPPTNAAVLDDLITRLRTTDEAAATISAYRDDLRAQLIAALDESATQGYQNAAATVAISARRAPRIANPALVMADIRARGLEGAYLRMVPEHWEFSAAFTSDAKAGGFVHPAVEIATTRVLTVTFATR